MRIYLGIALFIKGFVYLHQVVRLADLMHEYGTPFAGVQTAEIAALAHVAGGLLLTFGIFTRLGAVIQIPNVLGAILFVHLRDGLFTPQQTLELDLLVLVLLVLIAVGGPGRYSIDWYFGGARVAPRPLTESS